MTLTSPASAVSVPRAARDAVASSSDQDGPKRGRDGLARGLRTTGLSLASLGLFVVIWQALASARIWNETLLPAPATVLQAIVELSTTHDGVRGYNGSLLIEHLLTSLQRIALGAGVGIILGIVVGVAIGSVPLLRTLFEPWVTFLRTLPPLAYFSLLIIWLGIDEAPKITLLAIAAFPPVAVATSAAISSASVSLVEAARALGATRWQVLRDVVLPSALPEILTGIRLAVGVAYSSLVAAELVNGLPGIGGMVKDAANYNNTPVVLAGIIAIGLSGLLIDSALVWFERRVVPWRGRA